MEWWCVAAGVLGVVVCSIILAPFLRRYFTTPTDTPASIARHAVDALFARQSTTLAQASARYTLRTGRQPPSSYADWFWCAREKRCLIDDYDQIHRDFKPFYQLSNDNPAYFESRVARARQELDGSSAEIARLEIRDGEVYIAGNTAYGANWPDTLRHFSKHLPNMTFFMNGRDEPRVAFNYRAPGARENALLVNDSTPFLIQPRPTSDFFAHQSGCNIPLDATGFMSSANADSGFLISSAKPGFTTDIHSIPYRDWRGMSNGGMIIRNNYHQFARFKLVDIGRNNLDLMDVAITTFAETLCGEECDREAVVAEYSITGARQPRESLYHYKYAIDVDGTTFSGRFLGLLRSGSLVFKSTIFEEYFNSWLRPFEHYVPVLPDLSDLVQKIQWANSNPEEARLIQQRGLEVARRIITDDQNDCYLFGVLIEWAELQGNGRGDSN
ncbi:glycosyl transferase family 90-domain-containing protein [Mycena capillaripes]|nr:glycosyl transferase family 90-domain-containing protein [Mycena capillaripes]